MKKVKVNNKEYEVYKLPLGKYAEVLKSLDKLPKHLMSLDDINEDSFIEILPQIASDVLPELAKVLSIATSATEDEIMNEFGLADFIELGKAAIDENDLGTVGKVLGGMLKKTNTGSKK